MIAVLIWRPHGLFARSGQGQIEPEQSKIAPLVLEYFAKIKRRAYDFVEFIRCFGNAR